MDKSQDKTKAAVDQEPLIYHSQGEPGKITMKTTKPMNNQKDLSLAYSPGVAVPCLEIARDAHFALLSPHLDIVVALSGFQGTTDCGRGNDVRKGVALASACTAFTKVPLAVARGFRAYVVRVELSADRVGGED